MLAGVVELASPAPGDECTIERLEKTYFARWSAILTTPS